MNTKTRNLLFVAIFVVCMLAVALLLIFTQPVMRTRMRRARRQ